MADPQSARTSLWAFLREVGKHWVTLMSGGFITVALGLLERLSGKAVPLWVYGCVLVFFVFLACYLAWRDERQKHPHDGSKDKRAILAERLSALVKEAGDVDYGIVSLSTIEGLDKMGHADGHRKRVKKFLAIHYDAKMVERYETEGTGLLEELLADCYRSEVA